MFYKNPPLFLLHFSFVVILVGALCTFIWGERGYIHLREGAPVNEFLLENENHTTPLPFGIKLNHFEITCYKGTQLPSDYTSHIEMQDGDHRSEHSVSMNNIFSYRGYRFSQASFDEDLKGSILSVNHDPYGIAIIYTGYILLGLSMIWVLISKQSGFRKLLRSSFFRQGFCLILFLSLSGMMQAKPTALTKEKVMEFGKHQLFYADKMAPLQTFAGNFAGKIYGKTSYKAKAEHWYNKLNANTILYRLNLISGLLAFFYFGWSLIAGKRKRWIEYLFFALLISVFGFLSLNLGLRWYISEHIPLSNGYETMMFIAWSVLLIAILTPRKFFLIIASGLTISGFALLVSSLAEMNPQITFLSPVLSSSWLSIHVSLVMISYTLLAFITLNGIISVILLLIGDKRFNGKMMTHIRNLQAISRLFLYPAVFLLAAGIFTGSVWANISWGCYWNWDPKEVWALITLIVYALPFHNKRLKCFNNPLFFHIYGIIAFSFVWMTYFGVNYFFGGIHSY